LAAPEANLLCAVDADLAEALGAMDRAVTRGAFHEANLRLAVTLDGVARRADQVPAALRDQIHRRREAAASIAERVDPGRCIPNTFESRNASAPSRACCGWSAGATSDRSCTWHSTTPPSPRWFFQA